MNAVKMNIPIDAVGKLLFVSSLRPYIVFAVHNLSKYLDLHGEDHYKAVLRLIQYLGRTTNCGLNIDNAESNH